VFRSPSNYETERTKGIGDENIILYYRTMPYTLLIYFYILGLPMYRSSKYSEDYFGKAVAHGPRIVNHCLKKLYFLSGTNRNMGKSRNLLAQSSLEIQTAD
jgi:hypothetical protein